MDLGWRLTATRKLSFATSSKIDDLRTDIGKLSFAIPDLSGNVQMIPDMARDLQSMVQWTVSLARQLLSLGRKLTDFLQLKRRPTLSKDNTPLPLPASKSKAILWFQTGVLLDFLAAKTY